MDVSVFGCKATDVYVYDDRYIHVYICGIPVHGEISFFACVIRFI